MLKIRSLTLLGMICLPACAAEHGQTSDVGQGSGAGAPPTSPPDDGAPSARPLDATTRRQVIERLAQVLAAEYVFPEVGVESGKHLKAELARGAFDRITDPKEFAMKTLIVHAHPEPRSLNSSLKDLAVSTLEGAGHEVRVSEAARYAGRAHRSGARPEVSGKRKCTSAAGDGCNDDGGLSHGEYHWNTWQ